MPITFKCPRCGVGLTVPEEKAGRRGRCPTCGGPLKVPIPEKQAPIVEVTFHEETNSLKVILAIGIPLVLIAGGYFIYRAFHHTTHTTSTVAIENGEESEAARAWVDENFRVQQLDGLVHEFIKLATTERRLRARYVLSKTRNYESVTPYESELRTAVLEEQTKAVAAAQAAGTESPDWKLDTPLTLAEVSDMNRFSEQLVGQSKDIAEKMKAINMPPVLTTDPLGRTLLNSDDASAKITARKADLKARQATLK